MFIVVSVEDPQSYAEFDCALDAEIYCEVAKASGVACTITRRGAGQCDSCKSCPVEEICGNLTIH